MADNDVTVNVGANLENLTTAMNNLKGQLGSLQGYVGELAGYFGMLNNVGALVAGTLATLGLESFTRRMVESGVETTKMALSLGVTVEQLTRIKAAAGLAGVDTDRLALTLERLSLNIQRSTRDAFTPQAEALKVLGLNAKDLIGLSADQYFDKLAVAASRFNPSLNLTNALMTLGGKSMADMVAAFVRGGGEFHELIDTIAKTNAVTSQFAVAADDTHLKLGYMDAVVNALSKRLFIELKPAIDAVIVQSRVFAQSIKQSIDAGGTWSLVLKGLADVLKGIVTIMNLFNLALNTSIVLAQFFFETIQHHGVPNIKQLKDGMLDATDTFVKAMDRLTGINREAATFKDRWEAMGSAIDKLNAKPIDFQGRERLQMMQAQLEEQVKLADIAFEKQSLLYDRDVLLNRMTEEQKIRAVESASQQRYALQIAALQKELTLYGLQPTERQKIENQITEITQKALNDRVKMQNDYLKTVQNEWKEVIGAIQTSWDSQLRGLLQGTTTWKEAMKSVFTDVVVYAIKKFEELLIIKPILAALADSFSPATFFTDIFNVIKKLIGQVFAGATAFFAPELGPAAPAAGAAVAAATETAALSYDTGAWSVPNTAHALVHRDEMILPVDFASAVRSALTGGSMGGSSNLTLSLQAWDAPSVQRWLRSGGADMLARAISATYNQNPTIRPRY